MRPSGGMADAVDSKSTNGDIVGVQVPSRALHERFELRHLHRRNSANEQGRTKLELCFVQVWCNQFLIIQKKKAVA